MLDQIKTFILIITILLTVSCGGGGSSSSGITNSNGSGFVVDGVLANASVFLDINGNGAYDSGEPTTSTGSDGSYTLSASTAQLGSYPVVVKAIAGTTIDFDNPGVTIASGFNLTAPVGTYKVISPLTTLIVANMNSGLSQADAEAQLSSIFNISSEDLYSNYVVTGNGSLHNVAAAVTQVIASVQANSTLSTTFSAKLNSIKSQTNNQVIPNLNTIQSASSTTEASTIISNVINGSNTIYKIGGSISGLSSSGLVLSNGSSTVSPAPNAKSFYMPGLLSSGNSYLVSVQTQPTGQTCSVINGVGQIYFSSNTNITINCLNNPQKITGSISGLTSSGLTIQNGNETLAISSGATTFSFQSLINVASLYSLSITTQPTGQTCSISNGVGTMSFSGVNNVQITCHVLSFSVGGGISGLVSNGLVLSNGSDTLAVAPSNASFIMPSTVAYGGGYSIGIQSQPIGQTCSVSNGTGLMSSSNITAVTVTCSTNSYSIGGTVSGLTTPGLTLINSDTLAILPNSSAFTFNTRVAFGGAYSVSIVTQPKGQFCTLMNGSGTNVANTVTNISVSCSSPTVHVIHSFAGGVSDGSGGSSIIQGVDGYLYGITSTGGGTLNQGIYGGGVIYKLSTTGVYSILYSFDPLSQVGYEPGPFIQASDGNFYGFTNQGGAAGYGSLFKITPSGVITVLTSFSSTVLPRDLIQGLDGNLYCLLASYNGFNGRLTQFTLSGVMRDIFVFNGSQTSSGSPLGFTQGIDGNFYTVSSDGGAGNNGTVSKIAPNGVESILISLAQFATNPYGVTQANDGFLYVVTAGGGANSVGSIFKISTSGNGYSLLHSFQNTLTDGIYPSRKLIQGSDGNLYGVTPNGGAFGNGTLYSITPSGVESVLYSFGATGEGNTPLAPLIQGTDGNFYGTTQLGGVSNLGTVFFHGY